MLAARIFCTVPLSSLRAAPRIIVQTTQNVKTPFTTRLQLYANDARGPFQRARVERRRTLKETLMAPATDTAFTVGKGALAGASAFGLGCLCYYGIGLSNEIGAIDKAYIWPEYVRDRIRTTYAYFGGSIMITAASAMSVFQSRALMNLLMKNSWVSIALSLGAVIGTGMVARSLPYEKGLGPKQLAWMVHSSVVGALIAPLCLLGGPLLIRAACYTAGVVGGLSTVAACAPSEKFLNMGGPLAMGLGVVFVSSLGTMFLPPTTALGAGLYSMSLYGGLILFSGFLLYDTQRIMRNSEMHPVYAIHPYDPINESISIYMDTINIFIRIVQILAGGGSRR